MDFQFFVEKLKDSEEYKKFMKEFPDAFPFSGFFVLDLENLKNPDNKQHIDFYIPSKNKAFSFQMEDNCKRVPVDIVDRGVKEISFDNLIDFDEITELVLNEMKARKVKNKVQKILLSLQDKDGKDFLIGTVFISAFGLVKINIDVETLKVLDFEKKSFLDMLKITRNKDNKKENKK